MSMEAPPLLMDGSRVVEYAFIEAAPTGHLSVDVGGMPVSLETVRALAIAENLVEGGVFLLHCNEHWDSVAASYHATTEAAREAAKRGYAGIEARWEAFRPLTDAEQREVEVVRQHLREMAAQFPNE